MVELIVGLSMVVFLGFVTFMAFIISEEEKHERRRGSHED